MTHFFRNLITVAPLCIPALFLSFGILIFWIQNWIYGTYIFFCSFLIIIGLMQIPLCQKIRVYVCSSIFFIVLGFFVAKKQIQVFEENEQLLMKNNSMVYATITDIEKTPFARFPYCVTLHVVQVKQDTQEAISCNITLKCCTFRYGQCTVGDYVTLPFNAITPAKEVFRFFLIKEGIGVYLFIPNLQLTLLARPAISFSRFLYRKRASLFASLKQQCSEKTALLFQLLFLGRKEKEHTTILEIHNSFRQWGVAHMIARSGMHMTIFIMICYVLLQFFPMTYRIKQVLLALIALLYAFFSYSSISFIRALLTTFFLLYCHCILTRTNMLHLTLLVYIIQLLCNPIALFFLDFQLSFLLTIGIGFFSKRIFLKY